MSSNSKTTSLSTRKSQPSHQESNSSATKTIQSNQHHSHHALQKQGTSSKTPFWSNAPSRTTAVKPTSSTPRSQGTTTPPSLFSFSPTFHTNVQRHPSTPLSTAVQMLPASASAELEKSSISKKSHGMENSNNNPGTAAVRVKKEKPDYSSSKLKTVSFAMVGIISCMYAVVTCPDPWSFFSCMHDLSLHSQPTIHPLRNHRH